ncbi:putative protein isoform X2 [Capsicum chacoense]
MTIQLEPYGVGTTKSQPAMHKLQFSEVESSRPAKVTKIEQTQKEYDANRDVKRGLSVGYWSTKSLSKLASAVGRSLHTDSFTTSMERISYARILIELDVSQPFVEKIDLATPYGEFQQTVEYDWIPKFYKHCMKFGHCSKDCWNGSEEGDKELEFKGMQRKKQWNRGRIKLPL